MPEHKGNPSGKNAEDKKDAGRQGSETKRKDNNPNTNRTQRIDAEGNEAGRNRKAGAPN